MSVYIHPTSIVDDGAAIGDGTKVWHFCHIMSGSSIGKNCILGQNVYIDRNVHIGNRCKLQNNVSVYTGVTLEEGVFCGPSCVFTNVINPRAMVERKDEFKNTLIKRGASIGANSTIVCGVTLGEFCFIAAGAVVTKNVEPYTVVAGVPAKVIGYACECGELLKKIKTESKEKCLRCGQTYLLKDENIILKE